MRDSLFFSIAFALAAGMVAVALSFGESPKIVIQDICETGLVFEGDALNRLEQVEGTSMVFVQATATEPAHVVMEANLSRDLAPPSAGIFMPIGEAYATVLNGRRIQLTVRARQHAQTPLRSFDAAYFSLTSGSTTWQSFDLLPEYENFQFEHQLKETGAAPDLEYFGIWPGMKGEGKKMDVQSMSLSVLSGCD